MTIRTWEEIQANLNISGFGLPGDAAYDAILQALQFAYNAPSAPGVNLQQAWNDWIDSHPGQGLSVIFTAGTASASFDFGAIYIDQAYVEGLTYITPTGQAVSSTLNDVLIHELGHVFLNLPDDATISFGGTNTVTLNDIYSQIGIPQHLHYWGASYAGEGLLTPNFNYTGGAPVDIAIVLSATLDVLVFNSSHTIDTSSNVGSKDLLIGGLQDDTLISGAGNDFLYGGIGSGADTLIAGAGSDKLYGQDGNDFLYGNAAAAADDLIADVLDGGNGFDTYYTEGISLFDSLLDQYTTTSDKITAGAAFVRAPNSG